MTNKEWLEINEVLAFFDVSESTLRRYIKEFKNNKEIVRKNKNKYILNYSNLVKTYQARQTYSNEQFDQKNKKNEKQDENKTQSESKQEKTVNNDERYRADIIRVKELELLNTLQDKATKKEKTPLLRHSTFWAVIVAIIIIISILFTGWEYRKEIIQTFNSKINDITSSKDQIIKEKETNLDYTRKQLNETRAAYQETLKAVDQLHLKYNDRLETKEKEYQSKLEQEQIRIKQLEEKIKELTAPKLLDNNDTKNENI